MIVPGVAASLGIAAWLEWSRPATPPPNHARVAVSDRIEGQPRIELPTGATQRLAPASAVHADDVLATDAGSRAGLRTEDGSSVRIDSGSRVRFIGHAVIEVIAGSLYVSTASESHGFEIRTSMGVVRDLGTQFVVRVLPSTLRVRVRSGTVELRRGDSVTQAVAGTETTLTGHGIAVRPVPTFGTEWAWTAGLAGPFAMEGRTVDAFLAHIAHEEGWTLTYADSEVAHIAARTRLHGSVDGLLAEEALHIALATSGLRYRLDGGDLMVSRSATGR
jgi:ferric-dicitrate binding protein FerR (iron transport regulator)